MSQKVYVVIDDETCSTLIASEYLQNLRYSLKYLDDNERL